MNRIQALLGVCALVAAPAVFAEGDAEAGKEVFDAKCMVCHNAYPDVERGSDLHGEADLYPAELPEGIGCQRCHGYYLLLPWRNAGTGR